MVQDRTRPEGAAETVPVRGKRRSRLGLFLPYILLALVVVGWSAGWISTGGDECSPGRGSLVRGCGWAAGAA